MKIAAGIGFRLLASV